MAVAEKVDNRIVVAVEWRHKYLVKMCPGARWDTDAKTWWVPLAWASCQILRGIFGQELETGPALRQWAWGYYRRYVESVEPIRTATHYAGREDVPYAFQEPDVDFLCWSDHALLGNDMGLGKTRVAVLALRKKYLGWQEDVFPVIIFCPNSTKTQWADHVEMFFPEATPYVIDAKKNKKKTFVEAMGDDHAIVIVNHESSYRHGRLAPYGSVALTEKDREVGELNQIDARTVIVDEAHRMKDPKAKTTRAIWGVQHGKNVQLRIAMTGTPIANHVGDLWSIMHGVAPSDFPTKTAFIDRYALQSWNAFGGLDIIGLRPDTKDEFYRLFDPHFRRMPKELVLPWLPKKVREVRQCPMNPKQSKAYKEMEAGQVTKLEDGSLVIATNNLTLNTRLIQFSSSYAEVLPDGSVRLHAPSTKVKEFADLVEDAGKPIVGCAESRQLIELTAAELEKRHISYSLYVGGMTQDQRDAVKRDFIEGRTQVFLFTIKAGGTGLDGLQSQADTIVFLQRSWSLLECLQAEDRIHRIGSEVHGESITIVDLVAPGTVEEKQIQQLYTKAERLEEINRDRARLQQQHQDTSELDREAQLLEQGYLWEAPK
jgi:SNF2 family DNA or RNA helicase